MYTIFGVKGIICGMSCHLPQISVPIPAHKGLPLVAGLTSPPLRVVSIVFSCFIVRRAALILNILCLWLHYGPCHDEPRITFTPFEGELPDENNDTAVICYAWMTAVFINSKNGNTIQDTED